MPLYEYYCDNCNTYFEQIRPFSEADEPIPCSHCFNNKQVKRKLSKIAAPALDVSSSTTSNCSGCTSHNCANCH